METINTPDGPHPPETWAALSARMIAGAHDNGNLHAQALREAIELALVPLHQAVQVTERTALANNPAHMDELVELDADIDRALWVVLTLAETTPFRQHFADPAVQDAVRNVVGRHFINEIHIERLWHAEHHPDDAYVQAFKQRIA